MVDVTTLLGGGAIAATIFAAWNYIKIYLIKLYGIFVVRIALDESDTLRTALMIWAMKKTKPSKITLRRFWGTTDFVKPIGKNQLIAYETTSPEPTIHWYKKRPFILTQSSITFFRWTYDANVLIKEIIDYFNESQRENEKITIDRFFIRRFAGSLKKFNQNGNKQYGENPSSVPKDSMSVTSSSYEQMKSVMSPVGWNKEDIGQMKKPDPLSYLALSQEALDVILETHRWRKSEQWYKDRQIPHKKGILLYGAPGNGKSSFAKALAMDLNIPIMIFDLSNMTNDDFSDAWSSVKNATPCMVLFEDIDAIFDGRKNTVHEEGGLSFDCLLNSMDGVEAADGILIVATTNNIEKIDPALGKPNGDNISTRPGRIDRALELVCPSEEGRYKIARRILVDFPEMIDIVVKEGNHDTGAQFQERCSRLALKLFWTHKK